MDADGKQSILQLVPKTEKVGDDDACLHWLRQRHPHLRDAADSTSAGQLSRGLENDVRACDTLRWSRFSFPSDPHQPLRSNYNNETGNSNPVRAKLDAGVEAAASEEPARVVLESAPRSKGGAKRAAREGSSAASETAVARAEQATPSQSILREVVLKRDLERQLGCRSPFPWQSVVSQAGAARPLLGGYVAAPHLSDQLRFLVFPQWHHSLFPEAGVVTAAGPSSSVQQRRAETPQEVPYYVRGSVHFHVADRLPLAELRDGVGAVTAASWGTRVQEALRVSIAGARKFPFQANNHSLRPPAAVDVEAYVNHKHPERRYAPETGKVERRTLMEDGFRLAVYRGDPRYSTSIAATRATVENSHHRYRNGSTTEGRVAKDDMITGFTVEDAYDSAVQFFKPTCSSASAGGSYRVQWRAGPGIEYSSSDDRTTVFGKLSSEAWAEWPFTLLNRPFKVKVRNQSCLMRPLELVSTSADAHVGGETTTPGAVNTDNTVAGAVRSTAHEYLWATQGPKWNPKLLRGFDDDYSNMHHSHSWYSAFSVELSKKKARAGNRGRTERSDDGGEGDDGSEGSQEHSTGPLGKANVLAFANACFVDSFRQYPRASVGFSLTSELPRYTVDAFNKIMPHKFECSFSWFVAFKEKQLQTGLQPPELPEHLQYMRVSPVETFRHMKCGLTWKF